MIPPLIDQHELDALLIDDTHREREPEALQKRWWDYFDLHPTDATRLFTRCYNEAWREFYAKNIDIRTVDAEHGGLIHPDIFKHPSARTPMWLARQAADLLGLPYPFVMAFAVKRFHERQFHRLGRPNQLYGEEFEGDLKDAWERHLREGVRWAARDEFKASKWVSLKTPQQRRAAAAHQLWLLAQLRQRAAPRYRLLARMLREDLLSALVVEREFGTRELEQAQRYAALLG